MKKLLILAAVVVVVILVFASIANNHKSKPTNSVSYKGSYVAMGDSVAAGVGLETYSDSSACDRTNQSYPNLVASGLNFKLSSFACSGASVESGILGKQDVNNLMVSPQLNQLFASTRPKLITLTVGANDTHWTDFLTKCTTGTCGTPEDTAAVGILLTSFSSNLNSVMQSIANHYGSSVPHVIVTGYYQFYPANSASCRDLTGVDPSEQAWARQQVVNLNNAISSVTANYSYARFASVDFSGHELCTPQPWVQGIDAQAPYHPTDAGQADYAKQIINTDKLFK